jgi:hypothetical protein
MNKFFRAIIAAWGAKKLGGGCLSTIVIFVLIYIALGKCSNTRAADAHKQMRPAVLCKPANQLKTVKKDSLYAGKTSAFRNR